MITTPINLLRRTVHICILTHNRRTALQRLLTSPFLWSGLTWWRQQLAEMPQYGSILVLDQGSTDDTEQWMQSAALDTQDHPLHYLKATRNLGVAGGRNFVVQTLIKQGLGSEDVVVFLDDDIVPLSGDWLARLVAPILHRKAQIAGVEGWTVLSDGMVRRALPGELPHYVSGGWCAIRGDVFRHVAQWDERFNPNYYEDVDFCFTAQQRGLTIQAVGDVGLHHDQQDNPDRAAISAQSRVAFNLKWGEWRPPCNPA